MFVGYKKIKLLLFKPPESKELAFTEIKRGRGDSMAGRTQGFGFEHVTFEVSTRPA